MKGISYMKRIEIPVTKNNNDDLVFEQRKSLNNSDKSINYDKVIAMNRLWYLFFHNYKLSENELSYLKNAYHLEYNDSTRAVLIELLLKDIATTFNCNLDEITSNVNALICHPSEYVVFLGDLNYLAQYPKLKYVIGDVTCFGTFMNEEYLSSLEIIGGDANFRLVSEMDDALLKLKYILGNANFTSLKNANNLSNLIRIGGNAQFNYITDSSCLANLEYIGGYADFSFIKTIKSLPNLNYIGNLENSSIYNLIPVDQEILKTRVKKKGR